MEVKKIVEGMTAQQVAQVIDDNFKAQNAILEEDIAKQNSVIGVSEYKDFSEAEAVNVGDVRKYNGFLYECVEATTGAFDESKWKKSSFKAETEKMLSGLGSEVNSLNVERGFEVLNPIGINGVYVLDGVISVQQRQKINVIRVKKGDELTVAKKETSTSSLRFGVYDEFPKIGSSTSIYKTESDSFSYEVEKDGYFAVSSYLTDIVAFSMKSKRDKQIEENNEKLTKISEETKLEIGSLKAKLLTSTPSNPNSFNLINPNNSIEGYYIGSVGNFIENPEYSVAVIPMFGNNVSVVHSGGFHLAAVDENMNVTHVNEYNANNSEGKRILYKYGDVYVLVSFKKTDSDYVAYYSNISGSANLPYNNYAEYSKVKAAVRYGESLMDINFLNSETDLTKIKINLSRKVEEYYISAAGSLETNSVNRLAIYMFPVGADTFFYVEGKISSTNNVSCVVLSNGVSTTGVRHIEDRAKGCNGDFSYFGKTDEANTWVWVISDMDYEPTVIVLRKEPIFVSTKNLARYIYKGIYLDSSGSIGENKDYCVTDYIRLSEEIGSLVVSVDGMMQSEGSANIIAYDENKQYVKSLGNITETKGVVKWEDGISYVRFSVRNYGSDKVQVEKGIKSTDYISPLLIKENYIGYYIPEQPKAEVYNPVIKISEELAEGQSYTVSKTNYIRKNNLLTAHIETNGIFDSFTFGLGKNAYRGYWLTVTDTQIIVTSTGDSINEVVNHDMTLENVVDVIVDIDSEWKGTVRLQSKGVSKIFNIAKWVGAGALFVQNSGNSSKKAEVSLFSKDLKSDIWGYGDSYFSFNDSSRWTYYLLNWGYDNMLLDHLPGAASATMYNALLVDLELGKPKYMLWALGMNDSADTTEVNGTWLSYIQKFISICKSKNITPILCTIPSVPNKSHELKSEWVRNSGCRYIDFAKAVGAQSDGTWFEGMLSSDKVHPTSKGAIALASQAICDFPELTNLVR